MKKPRISVTRHDTATICKVLSHPANGFGGMVCYNEFRRADDPLDDYLIVRERNWVVNVDFVRNTSFKKREDAENRMLQGMLEIIIDEDRIKNLRR